MYTGSFNTSGCEPRDLEYLCKLSASQPLVDISKFVFFGRADADPVTASADSFAAETLAPALSKKSRLLAAAVVVFAEEPRRTSCQLWYWLEPVLSRQASSLGTLLLHFKPTLRLLDNLQWKNECSRKSSLKLLKFSSSPFKFVDSLAF